MAARRLLYHLLLKLALNYFLMTLLLTVTMTKLMKSGFLLTIWFVMQISPRAETVFGRLLEYGVSFALLAIIAFIFYREWKSSDGYNKNRDEVLEDLIRNNTEAMYNTKNAIDDMSGEMKTFRQELKSINGLVKANTSRISSVETDD